MESYITPLSREYLHVPAYGPIEQETSLTIFQHMAAYQVLG